MSPAAFETDRLLALAQAVADGRQPHWDAAHGDGCDARERGVIAQLQAVADISHVIARLTSVSSLAASDHGSFETVRPDTRRAATPEEWGGLRIRERIGSGRFGDVYRAWDPSLDRDVALKLLRRRRRAPVQDNARVIHEGRMMARVRHPNVATIYGASEIDGDIGLWMEFIEGRTLEDELHDRKTPFAADELSAVGVELCRAVSAVHRAGLIHRDIKTQNVMREASGRLVLTDFGTGRELDESRKSDVAGTPVYLAPETFGGEPPSASADIYSVGVLLFYLASRRFPVEGRSAKAIRAAHERSRRTTLRALRPDLPGAVCEAIERAAHPLREHRFDSIDALSDALRDSVAKPGTGPAARARPNRAGVSLLIALLLTTSIEWRAIADAGATASSDERVIVTAPEGGFDDPALDARVLSTLQNVLITSSPYRPLERDRMAAALTRMRKPTAIRIDRPTGREIALRDGTVQALIVPRVKAASGGSIVTCDIVRVFDGSVLQTVSERVPARHEMRAVRRVGAAAASAIVGLRSQLDDGRARLAKATTSSLEALQFYTSAEKASSGGSETIDWRTAESLARRAVEIDPDFAKAHLLLAHSIANRVGTPPVEVHHPLIKNEIALAVAAAADLDEAERLEVIAKSHQLRGQLLEWRNRDVQGQSFAQAVAGYQQVLTLDPQNEGAIGALVDLSMALSRWSDARDYASRFAEMRPGDPALQVRAAMHALALDDIAASRKYVDRVRALNVGPRHLRPLEAAWFGLFNAHVAWLSDDLETALVETQRFEAEAAVLPQPTETEARVHVFRMYMALGRLQDAERIANEFGPGPRETFAAASIGQRGDTRALAKYLRQHLGDDPERAHNAGSALVEAGLLDTARAVVDRHRRLGNPSELEFGAQLAWAEGRLDEAIPGLLRAMARNDSHWERSPRLRTSRWLADAYRQLGRLDDAIRCLEDVRSRGRVSVGPSAAWQWLRARAALADLYRQVGRHADADAVETELLQLLRLADDDHAIKRRILERRATTSR